ncbi:dephospho-CoA kinase [Gracilimonas sp.]|uniref:dephospho-CoA kinase n=1 Tax=Gracilimonas sp. TaxID=1974203 RepID=UPI00287184D8|nr:dephospho-CoA kinase [Gracilimonas sp.]
MIKVGITGGIGSGKTTFCKEWEKLGATVLYADDFAKQLMLENQKLKNQIKQTFGEQAYNEQGELNRAFLAKEAFEKGRVEELNDLVHPVLWEEVEGIAEQEEQKGTKVFAKEAAILLNNGRPEGLDYVIIILADKQKRIERTLERDEATKNSVEERMAKQPDFENLTHLADYVVVNDGSISELKEKARRILEEIETQV